MGVRVIRTPIFAIQIAEKNDVGDGGLNKEFLGICKVDKGKSGESGRWA